MALNDVAEQHGLRRGRATLQVNQLQYYRNDRTLGQGKDVWVGTEPGRRPALDRARARVERRIRRLDGISRRYGWARLALFCAGVLAGVLCWRSIGAWAGLSAGAAFLLAFGAAVAGHNRVDAALRRYGLVLTLTTAQLARLDRDWTRLPTARVPSVSSDHPFAADLDLVGERSLHRLIDTAVSREGSERLRDWLLETAPDAERIRQRQTLVRALASRPLPRNRLALTALEWAGKGWDGEPLRQLLAARAAPLQPRVLALAPLVLLLDGLVLWSAVGPLRGPTLLVGALVLAGGVFVGRARLTGRQFAGAPTTTEALEAPRRVLAYLETAPYGDDPDLRRLCAPLTGQTGGVGDVETAARPSAVLRRLSLLASLASLRQSLAWPLINAVLPLDVVVAYGLSRATDAAAAQVPGWLEVWFELEALGALANLAWLHPRYAWPTLHDADAGSIEPVFEARALAHPLIADAATVANDFTAPRMGEVGLITGSNMSGKSSFLRAVGVNLCLANAGGPVDAAILRTVIWRVHTSIAISDSVTAGYSYFYAEVRRLRALLEALDRRDAPPLFFLIDEIFRGTNNRERLRGARAYLRAVTGRRGVGLVSTHDLDLVELAEALPAMNTYHFRDDVVDGRLVFDYLIRPGPSPTTNALTIMRLEGLPVEEPTT